MVRGGTRPAEYSDFNADLINIVRWNVSVVSFVLIQWLYIILWILGSTDLGMTDEFTCGYPKLSGTHRM